MSNGTTEMLKAKDRVILSIKSISFLGNIARVIVRPGMNKKSTEPKITRIISSMVIFNDMLQYNLEDYYILRF